MANVRWSDDEWTKLTDIVEQMRLSDPCSSLVSLVNAAQKQMPEDRRRSIISTQNVQPLVDELHRRMQGYRRLKDEVQSLTDRLINSEPPDEEIKKAVLEDCTPAELLNYIHPETALSLLPLEELAAYVEKEKVRLLLNRQLATVEVAQAPVFSNEVFTRKGLLKVYVAGPLNDQYQKLRQLVGPICDLRLITELGDIHSGGDLYVAWIKFMGHRKTEKMKQTAPVGAYHQVVGGLETLAYVIQQEVKKLAGV